jgi:hypothetical protein
LIHESSVKVQPGAVTLFSVQRPVHVSRIVLHVNAPIKSFDIFGNVILLPPLPPRPLSARQAADLLGRIFEMMNEQLNRQQGDDGLIEHLRRGVRLRRLLNEIEEVIRGVVRITAENAAYDETHRARIPPEELESRNREYAEIRAFVNMGEQRATEARDLVTRRLLDIELDDLLLESE